MIELSMQAITDLKREAADCVFVLPDHMAFFIVDWVKAKGWKIGIEESKFRDHDSRLSRACSARDLQMGDCVWLTHEGVGYDLALDHSSLSSLHRFFVAPSYLLLERNRRFLMLSDCDYYWALASDADFISSIFTQGPVQAIEEFREAVAPYLQSKWPDARRVGRELTDFADLSKATWA